MLNFTRNLFVFIVIAICGPFGFTKAASKTTPDGIKLSDGEVIGIIEAMHKAEVALASLSSSRTSDEGIRKFSAEMVRTHSSHLIHIKNLSVKNHMRSESTTSRQGLETATEVALAKLKGLKDSEFNTAFRENQIALHQSFLGTFDIEILPNARSPELKDHVAKLRTEVEQHLAEAKRLLQKP